MHALCQNTSNTHGNRFAQLTALTLLQENPIASIITIFFQNSLSRSVDFSRKPPLQRGDVAMETPEIEPFRPSFPDLVALGTNRIFLKVKQMTRHFPEMSKKVDSVGRSRSFRGKLPTCEAENLANRIRTTHSWGRRTISIRAFADPSSARKILCHQARRRRRRLR